MLDKSVGEYCKDGAPHEWTMHATEGQTHVTCQCGSKAAQFVSQWAMEIAPIPVKISFPRVQECEDTPWLDISPRL